MLAAPATDDLISTILKNVSEMALLPPEEGDFFLPVGIMPVAYEEHRCCRRFYCRRPAVLRVGDEHSKTVGVYCRDISQRGAGFLSPRQMLPLEQARLVLSENWWFDVRVRWCRRFGPNCYGVGCDFEAQGASGPSLWSTQP